MNIDRRDFLKYCLSGLVGTSAFLLRAKGDAREFIPEDRRDLLNRLGESAKWNCCPNAYEGESEKSESDLILPNGEVNKKGDGSIFRLISIRIVNRSDKIYGPGGLYVHADLENEKGEWSLIRDGRFKDLQNLVTHYPIPSIAPGDYSELRLYFLGLSPEDFCSYNTVNLEGYARFNQDGEETELKIGKFAEYKRVE